MQRFVECKRRRRQLGVSIIGNAVSDPPPNSSAMRALLQANVNASKTRRWIGFTRPAWAASAQAKPAIRDRMLRQIVENNERIHSIVHEPFAQSRAGEWCQVLVGQCPTPAAEMIVVYGISAHLFRAPQERAPTLEFF